ncbi:hypothetical protein [Streptomyces hygroscopicus]|uniref:hypothetical protein n=1 Tax=Streptomyces hygroscopicus TaxID=1912 RepID=UPI001FCB2766|nr:hypothetical protein [Streptomyces hygroscopicus]BDH16213.1 hypothetical protein HOK021_73920 [Streptomyces hygroscopicus]
MNRSKASRKKTAKQAAAVVALVGFFALSLWLGDEVWDLAAYWPATGIGFGVTVGVLLPITFTAAKLLPPGQLGHEQAFAPMGRGRQRVRGRGLGERDSRLSRDPRKEELLAPLPRRVAAMLGEPPLSGRLLRDTRQLGRDGGPNDLAAALDAQAARPVPPIPQVAAEAGGVGTGQPLSCDTGYRACANGP